MGIVDRSIIPSIHDAARQHRSVYVSCLLGRLRDRIAALFRSQPQARTVPCA